MIKVVKNRALGLHAGALALQDKLPGVTPEMLDKAYEEYEIDAFTDNGWAIGALVTKGPEIHVAIIPGYHRRWLSMRLIRDVLGGIQARHGYVVTQVMKDNEIGMRFVERLGFNVEREANDRIYYRMTQ